MSKWIILFALVLMPFSAFAQEQNINRLDGFMMIWETIKRPAEFIGERSYSDVPEEMHGHLEITYAKGRGLLEDTDMFHPNDPLTVEDAVLWLMRTRNVSDLDGMERLDIPEMLSWYPILDTEIKLSDAVGNSTDLLRLINELDKQLRDEVHEISYYADDFQGAGTAFGEKFDMYKITAAHRTLPYNTLVRVTNLDNGKSVVVRINDRGPYVHGRDMDLSHAAFEKIAEHSNGIVRRAQFKRLGDINLIESYDKEKPSMEESSTEESSTEEPFVPIVDQTGRRYQRRITRDIRFNRGVPHTLTLGETMTLGSTKFFVIRWIEKPDGSRERIEKWIDEDEKYNFTPLLTGLYRFRVGTGFGYSRIMQTKVSSFGG